MTTFLGSTVEVDPIFIMYAFRYALGRRSYAVADVSKLMETHALVIAERGWAGQVIERIDEAVREGEAGMDMDVERWMGVRHAMEQAVEAVGVGTQAR